MARQSIPKLLHKRVSIRRSGKVVRNVRTHLLVSEIKQGRLKEGDEISADEKFWVRLDNHYQLSSYFPTDSSSASRDFSPDLDQRLNELSEMLKDLNR